MPPRRRNANNANKEPAAAAPKAAGAPPSSDPHGDRNWLLPANIPLFPPGVSTAASASGAASSSSAGVGAAARNANGTFRGAAGVAAANANAAGPGVLGAAAAAAANNSKNKKNDPKPATPRTVAELYTKIQRQDFDRVPDVSKLKVNALAVNVWDMCARKASNKTAYQVEPGIKKIVLEFIGRYSNCNLCPGASIVGYADTAASIAAESKLVREKICHTILKKVGEVAREEASYGFKMYRFSVAEVVDNNDDVPWGAIANPNKKFAQNPEESDWTWLFSYLEDLRHVLTNIGGYKLDRLVKEKPDQPAGANAKESDTREVWKLPVVW
eukprot:CAMPEP_0179000822 /NCGR_PEP_ID=MMETSP0795-20121207/10935_1 /TAXON_ID=88552 /ORGANISM="Amoebophrya sp., Strain Ameob2" /LENGTH=327 /DNA_ID=CAMNT_0020693961 /DNA_START=302 /DNA_END=1282 /DNA_ORIENTATION=+